MKTCQVEERQVPGVVVLTQTCDIVRKVDDRPYLELCPLVPIPDPQRMVEIEKGLFPRYAYVPGAADACLVADLDRVMTVDKVTAMQWEFYRGCLTINEQRRFAESLARKRFRFAFPDEFVQWLRPLHDRVRRKHGKRSSEGAVLRLLSEIRVAAIPSWDCVPFMVTFYFLVSDVAAVNIELEHGCQALLDRLQINSIVRDIHSVGAT